jgi:hypothetical protein
VALATRGHSYQRAAAPERATADGPARSTSLSPPDHMIGHGVPTNSNGGREIVPGSGIYRLSGRFA